MRVVLRSHNILPCILASPLRRLVTHLEAASGDCHLIGAVCQHMGNLEALEVFPKGDSLPVEWRKEEEEEESAGEQPLPQRWPFRLPPHLHTVRIQFKAPRNTHFASELMRAWVDSLPSAPHLQSVTLVHISHGVDFAPLAQLPRLTHLHVHTTLACEAPANLLRALEGVAGSLTSLVMRCRIGRGQWRTWG